MRWTVKYKSKLSIIEVVFTGTNTGKDLREATSKAIALSHERNNSRFVVDAREIRLAATVFDLYDLPARQYPAENLDRRARVAVLLPKLPKEREDARFYEDACVNRGWLVKSFLKPEEAIAWLTDTGSPNNADAGDG